MILSLRNKRTDAGVAMVIVMVTIVVLGAMAASLSYSMKVEMTLARNNSLEPELEWLGRSGVEYAKWILAQDAVELGTMAPYDALNEVWAGGPGDFERNFDDSPLAGVSLRNNELGPGKFSITIEDLRVPVSGIPITVSRTYDTRQRQQNLDFGFG